MAETKGSRDMADIIRQSKKLSWALLKAANDEMKPTGYELGFGYVDIWVPIIIASINEYAAQQQAEHELLEARVAALSHMLIVAGGVDREKLSSAAQRDLDAFLEDGISEAQKYHAKANRRLAEVLAVLREHEWEGYTCPACDSSRGLGHDPACWLAALLAADKEAR